MKYEYEIGKKGGSKGAEKSAPLLGNCWETKRTSPYFSKLEPPPVVVTSDSCLFYVDTIHKLSRRIIKRHYIPYHQEPNFNYFQWYF